jgi:hypothetical protein
VSVLWREIILYYDARSKKTSKSDIICLLTELCAESQNYFEYFRKFKIYSINCGAFPLINTTNSLCLAGYHNFKFFESTSYLSQTRERILHNQIFTFTVILKHHRFLPHRVLIKIAVNVYEESGARIRGDWKIDGTKMSSEFFTYHPSNFTINGKWKLSYRCIRRCSGAYKPSTLCWKPLQFSGALRFNTICSLFDFLPFRPVICHLLPVQ